MIKIKVDLVFKKFKRKEIATYPERNEVITPVIRKIKLPVEKKEIDLISS